MNRVINVWQEVSYGAEVVVRERQLLAYSVEKASPSRLPMNLLLKTPFLRAAKQNVRPEEASAQSEDFNLKRVLSCSGNFG